MAVKKKTTEETPEQRTATVATEQAAEQAAPEEEVHGEQTGPEQTPEAAEVPETPSDPKEDVADAAPDDTAPKLESLSVLADRHRVVGWQQSALLRLMGWEDDKRVSDAEYRAALDHLKNRRIGGGRR
ncbi:hypothetical protein [Bilophila wadsworthia]|uniref:hypothetical protein n=1 Tax=Bilophila wadsworthia TaxID=35833 RepID=UPI001DB4D168|nr:hypothetical protein [Bilophila wadsworthia]MBS5375463.1 hypothetical protein [Bilophila wadsworthia]MCI6540517.1 hypothetical protein [Bilophila wadsworthia]